MTEQLPGSVDPPAGAVREAVARALAEDLLPLGDITAAIVPADARCHGHLVARQDGVLAGRLCATETFAAVDPQIEIEWSYGDGARLATGERVARVTGPLRSVLSAERTALNFLCHLSGIATLTRRFVDVVSSTGADTVVLDTRKTTPGLRSLEKAAVRSGGARNHRGSLSEGVLVKDNHLTSISIEEALRSARASWPGRLLEVECDTVEQAQRALDAGATMLLLDNMDPGEVKECVVMARTRADPALVEVSGGVNLTTAPAFAEAGADFVSVGAITHSAPVLDIALDLEP